MLCWVNPPTPRQYKHASDKSVQNYKQIHFNYRMHCVYDFTGDDCRSVITDKLYVKLNYYFKFKLGLTYRSYETCINSKHIKGCELHRTAG